MAINFSKTEEIINNAHNQKDIFLALKNLNMIFPFSIKNLNYQFFLDKEKHLTKNELHTLRTYEENKSYQVLKRTNKFLNDTNLKNLLNDIFVNIVNSTNKNNPIFKFNKDGYVNVKRHIKDFTTENEIKNFSFDVFVDEDNILYKLFRSLTIDLSFNKTIRRVSGDFRLNLNFESNLSFEDSIDMVYLLSLFKQNIDTQLLPLTIENIIEILNDANESTESKHEHLNKNSFREWAHDNKLNSIVDFKYISFDSLHHVWMRLVQEKFLSNHAHNFSKQRASFLRYDVFYAFMLMLCINIYILFELDSIFTSNAPFFYLDEKCLDENMSKESNDVKDLLDNLLKMIHNNYFHHGSIFRNPEVKTQQQVLIKSNALYLKNLKNNYILLSPSLIYDFSLSKQKIITHINDLFSDKQVLSLFLLILFPEDYLLNMSDKKLFPSLDTIYEYVDLLWKMNTDKFKTKLKNCLCENNYYYYSFIQNDNLIVLENNEYEEKHRSSDDILPYYVNSISFIHVRLHELTELEKIADFIEFTNEIKWKNIQYHKLISDLNDIEYEFDNFLIFMNAKFKPILLKFDDYYQLREKIDVKQEKVRWNDELFKRGIERGNFIVTFIVAILVGFVNYFAQVYSELVTIEAVRYGYPGVDYQFPWVPMTISFSSIAEFIMLIILAYAFYRTTYFRKKIKLIDNHKVNFL